MSGTGGAAGGRWSVGAGPAGLARFLDQPPLSSPRRPLATGYRRVLASTIVATGEPAEEPGIVAQGRVPRRQRGGPDRAVAREGLGHGGGDRVGPARRVEVERPGERDELAAEREPGEVAGQGPVVDERPDP